MKDYFIDIKYARSKAISNKIELQNQLQKTNVSIYKRNLVYN